MILQFNGPMIPTYTPVALTIHSMDEAKRKVSVIHIKGIVNPEDLLGINSPVDFTMVAFVGGGLTFKHSWLCLWEAGCAKAISSWFWLTMDTIVSAVAGDLVSRFISYLVQKYGKQHTTEGDLERLKSVLLRIHTIVEEAEARQIRNRGMILQLKGLMEGMFLGYYVLDLFKFQSVEEGAEDDQTSNKRFRFSTCTRNSPLLPVAPVFLSNPTAHTCSWTSACLVDILRKSRIWLSFQSLGLTELEREPLSIMLVKMKGWDVDVEAWKIFRSSMNKSAVSGSKVIIIGRTDEITKWGTAPPIRLNSLSPEMYWYYFKTLTFGSMNPDDHPKLAYLAMQLATELRGSFLGANILGHILRANPNAEIWSEFLMSLRGMTQKNLFIFAEHCSEANAQNHHFDTKVAFMSIRGYMVYDLRESFHFQSKIPRLTLEGLHLDVKSHYGLKFDVLVGRSNIPPFCNYLATFFKPKPSRRIVRRKDHLAVASYKQDLNYQHRFISSLEQNYSSHTCEEEDRKRLQRILLRIHSVVEEAEGRHITNQGMLLQLKRLIERFYLGYYMLDKVKFQIPKEESIKDEVSHEIHSSAVTTSNSTKRFRFADAVRKHTPVAFGGRSTISLKVVVEDLETTITDMREFVMLLGNYPRLPRQPCSTYLHIDKCMFGRRMEKEQVINFLLCNDPHDPYVSILPIIGPHRIGKKTLVQHACLDERVCNFFSHIFFFKEDDLKIGEFSLNSKASIGKYLFVIEFIWDVDVAAWTKFQSYLQNIPGTEIKVVVIGRTEDIAKFGTSQPIRMKRLSEEEYWYYFKALSFGSMNPDEHPKLASLGMQLATETNGSFLAANILGELLRANPNTQFWQSVLLSLRELVRKHLSCFGVHPEDLLERNTPVDFTRVAFVGAQVQGCMVYDLREADPSQSDLPKLTSREVLSGGNIPVEEKFDVLVWKSLIPPYCDYIATFEKQKPRRMVGKRNTIYH
uniref:Disease resistance N-terminal domain-containing protein n=1 Tax=Leersia perrieri TaxID=77586 RepID=A0A0D9XPD5_9ORYZ